MSSLTDLDSQSHGENLSVPVVASSGGGVDLPAKEEILIHSFLGNLSFPKGPQVEKGKTFMAQLISETDRKKMEKLTSQMKGDLMLLELMKTKCLASSVLGDMDTMQSQMEVQAKEMEDLIRKNKALEISLRDVEQHKTLLESRLEEENFLC